MDACREMNTVRKGFSDMPKRLLSIVLVLLGINQTGFGVLEKVPPGSAFSIGIEMPCQVPVTPAVENALRDIGIQYVNSYVKPWQATPDSEAEAAVKGMLEFVDRNNLDFALSCFVVDPPDVCVQEAAQRGGRFKGIVFDEIEHCRLLNPDANDIEIPVFF